MTIIRAYKGRTISVQSINEPIHGAHPSFPLQQQQARRVTKGLFYEQDCLVEAEHKDTGAILTGFA